MKRAAKFGIGMLSVLAWLPGCPKGVVDPEIETPAETGETPVDTGAIISNPRAPVRTTLARRDAGGMAFAADLPGAIPDIVYLSLAPGAYPDGTTAVIRSPRLPGALTASMTDGGLDPVPIAANAGDTLSLEILRASGTSLALNRYAVPVRRRPRVVRTVPPRGKTDVAINSSIVIVFSEPVSAATVSRSTVSLVRGALPVAGTVRLLPGTGTMAAFTPDASLQPNAAYRLIVGDAIADLEGETLESAASVPFTTGTSTVGAPASITVPPDTIYMPAGTTFQMTASVTDASGNELIDQPVLWESSNPSGLSVSSSGLLTALASGNYTVTAAAGTLVTSATVYVRGAPASLTIGPSANTVAVEEAIALSAVVRDAGGFALDAPVTWTINNAAIATVASIPIGAMVATVTGVAPGSATITGTSGGISGIASLTVVPRRAVASVTLSSHLDSLLVGDTIRLFATLRDAAGISIPGRPVTWESLDTAVARVDATGTVRGVREGTAGVRASSEGVSDTATMVITTLNLASLSATFGHSCGLTTAGLAYCWGRLTGLRDGSIASTSRPARVWGAHTFSIVTAGMTHSCGLTVAGAAYCWGYGDAGQLGDGTGGHSWLPVRAGASLTFQALSAGGPHTCGLTTGGQAYCWGSNSWGQLGDGSNNTIPSQARQFAPTPVAGGLRFMALAAGKADHTCGLTLVGEAYCWGRGDFGKLGNGTTAHSNTPVRVQTTLRFTSIVAGWHHVCALTETGAAYCWGGAGLGYGLLPGAIGGPTFTMLAAGSSHTCGLVADGEVFCWGFNEEGRIGDGTTINRPFPTRVSGGLTFSSITAGGAHSCGLTSDGAAYCWGWNNEGQLGIGSTTNSSVPVKVVGQR